MLTSVCDWCSSNCFVLCLCFVSGMYRYLCYLFFYVSVMHPVCICCVSDKHLLFIRLCFRYVFVMYFLCIQYVSVMHNYVYVSAVCLM